MGLTTDRADPGLREIVPGGQQATYLVLSDDERAKGFTRPVCRGYIHLKCGAVTTMGLKIAETYARDPKFYNGTFCCQCGTHFSLIEADPSDPSNPTKNRPAFVWTSDHTPVGSTAEEAAQFMDTKAQREADKHRGGGI